MTEDDINPAIVAETTPIRGGLRDENYSYWQRRDRRR